MPSLLHHLEKLPSELRNIRVFENCSHVLIKLVLISVVCPFKEIESITDSFWSQSLFTTL